ncbi:MAG TPA: prolipoprotein diacylglyceryl transferase [Steroidobacteraceae bacterium]|nr:prolipoprotein diacylglyceryl transferase [Steroidobacteraceae bacterium]
MTWNVDPVLLNLGFLQVHWYGLLFAGSFLVGYKLMQWIYAREGRAVQELDNLLLYIMIGTVVGARLAHCLFYDPQYFLKHPLEILMVWKGGLASHGGAVGVLLAAYLYCRQPERPGFLWLVDRMAIPAVLAGGMIRVGNFFNSEIYGKPTDGPLGVVFERVDRLPRHPVQLYEAAMYFAIFALLLWVYVRRRPAEGRMLGLYLMLVFAARFALEFLKVPQAAYEGDPLFSVGHLLSVPFVFAGLWFATRSVPARAVAHPT